MPRKAVLFLGAVLALFTLTNLCHSHRASRTGAKVTSSKASLAAKVDEVPSNRTGPALAPETAALAKKVQLLKPEDMSVTTHVSLRDVFPELNLPVVDWKSVMPDSITVCPVPGMPLTFHVVSKESNLQRNTWVGKNSIEGASLTFTATNSVWDAVLTLPGANQYAIHADNYGAKVVEMYDDRQICVAADIMNYREGDVDPNNVTAAADTTGPIFTVDIMVAYTTGSKATWGNTPEEVANRYASYLTAANTYLANSLVTALHFNVVGAFEVTGYSNTTGMMGNDLTAISSTTSTLGTLVTQKRNQYNADLVQFIVDGARDSSGLANISGPYSVIVDGVTAITATHELCHNIGCHHDRDQEQIPDSDTRYCFGFRYVDTNPPQNPDGSTPINPINGDIMAYCDLRLPYFSNPNVQYRGVTLGIAVGQPKAAYNARTLQENAVIAAAYKAGITDPVITTQPANVTVTTGNTFSLSVVATGANLTYQWYKSLPTGVTAIANATAASYSKTNADSTDVAIYYVIVANNSGATQSSSASVSTTAPTPTPTPNTPSSGGGGGGGAPSSLYLLTLVVTTASKKLMQRKRSVT